MLISGPEDYGLSPAETLAHTVAGGRPAGFDAYWNMFREEVTALPRHWRGEPGDAPTEVIIPSVRGVRVVARVTLPTTAPRGIVVTTHGSGAPDVFLDEPEAWSDHGVVTVRLRLRGYPPSTLDLDDLRGHWILHHIEAADAWIVRGAVADVLQAARCARRHFPGLPLSLHGESLGAGVAVLAAAQMTLDAEAATPFRLVVGLPTFGDWRWRRGRYCNGTGALVNMTLESLRQEQDRLLESLLLFDAALHAPDITCPALGKLAERDDVVPAPTAAAVFNALGSDDRHRFTTRFGHFDGGIDDLRRHALFERIHPAFVDPAVPPPDALAAEPRAARFLERL